MYIKVILLTVVSWIVVEARLLAVAAKAAAAKKDELHVVTVVNAPYVQLVNEDKYESIKNNSNVSSDIEGYAVDLLKLLAEEANFQYRISFAVDGRYGTVDQNTNQWNGMIGDVLKGNADLAIADLTVTQLREREVDFSYPFMTTGIGLLVKRPPYFSTDDENRNRTLLLYPVSSINDLPYQSEVQFGAVRHGSTYEFFQHSTDEDFKLIGRRMAANESMLSNSGKEAAERVKQSNGRYAFFMEGAAIEYLTGKSCNFMKLGNDIHSRSYAIAMRKNFPMKTRINVGLLALQEKGSLDALRKKWFGQVRVCDDTLASPYARNALNLVLRSIK